MAAETNDASWHPGLVLLAVRDRLGRGVDRLGATKRWTLWTAACAMALGIFLGSANPLQDLGGPQWDYTIEHSHGVLIGKVEPDSREANLTFRVVPRLVGRALHLTSPQHFLAVQAALALAMIVVIARLFEEALDDRRSAIVATFGTVGLWAVASGWVEVRGNFDAAAIMAVLVAMLVRRPPLIFIAGVAATFVDERAIFVLPAVAVWHLMRDDDGVARVPWRARPWPPAIAALAAIGGHLAIRLWLTSRYGMGEGTNRSPGNPWAQINNYPNGIWGALEGYWFVVLAGLVAMWRARCRTFALVLVAVAVAVLAIGVSVFDISRSVAYVFPLVPVALLALRGVDRSWTEDLLWVAAATSLVWPLLYAADVTTVAWYMSLPMWAVDRVTSA